MLHSRRWWQGSPGGLLVMSFALLAFSGSMRAFDFAGMFADKVGFINEAASLGRWDAYITGHAWHLPSGYDNTTRGRLNETALGGGFGRSIKDEEGDRHSVYFMTFADSHRDPQLNLGYAWQRYWPLTRNFSMGAGYLAFLFSRKDVANHLPMPAVLPCVSIRFRSLELIGLFVPRVSSDIKGNVLFFYLRVPLGRARLRDFQRASSSREYSWRRP